MASPGNQNPLSPYDNYRDCSSGICSIYCPHFCYLIFPPPPLPDEGSHAPISPLIITVLGVLASTFLLITYYAIVTKFCKRRRNNHNPETEENRDEWKVDPAGMAESLIEKITVCKYRKGDGLIDGTECAVCLSEFCEGEPLRLLPKCSHAFHLPCIDTWLKSQSSCPLCRAIVAMHNSQASPAVDGNVSAYEISHSEDLVLVVEDRETEQTVVISSNDEGSSDQEGVEQFRRSASLDTISSSRRQTDILKFEEIDEYVRVEIDELWRGVGSSEGDGDSGKDGKLLMSPVAMKRSISTGRFMDKGKSFVIPN